MEGEDDRKLTQHRWLLEWETVMLSCGLMGWELESFLHAIQCGPPAFFWVSLKTDWNYNRGWWVFIMRQACYVEQFTQHAQQSQGDTADVFYMKMWEPNWKDEPCCKGVTPAVNPQIYMTSHFPSSWRSLSSVWTAALSASNFLVGSVCKIPSIHMSQISRIPSRSSVLFIFFTKTIKRLKVMKFIPRFARIYCIIWLKYKDRYVAVSVSSQLGKTWMSKEPAQQRDVFFPIVLSGCSVVCCPCACTFFGCEESLRHTLWRRYVVSFCNCSGLRFPIQQALSQHAGHVALAFLHCLLLKGRSGPLLWNTSTLCEDGLLWLVNKEPNGQ